jgi:phage N-6-adenine-methyltransferase
MITQLALLPNIEIDGSDPHNDDNFTPSDYVDYFRDFVGCFDLDPFSCAAANQTVGASTYWTKEDDALTKDWSKYQLKWCNPPYSDMDRCIAKILSYKHIGSTLILANSNTDSDWYQDAVQATKENGAYLLFNKRIEFLNSKRILRKQMTGKGSGNNKGQTLFYYGELGNEFADYAKVLGVVSRCL